MNLLTSLYQTISSFQALPGMALWSKSSPVSLCLSRYGLPLCRPVRHAGNGNETLFSACFTILGDVRAALSVELACSTVRPKWMTLKLPTAISIYNGSLKKPT
ncbi:hypothetical protein ATANTOWER_024178 [Ataeniobius toweri]|uniref:Uncharacterized protein n=1 Tax=Ataeniobius toweri TaxID=208326 RepID=A0ABU7C0H2_9TELE|nr:hypothetical protein [Ataeniobius toweri]